MPGLLEDTRFQPLKGEPYLTIKNVTLQDKGNYTCLTTYMHMGKFYNVSRTINLDVEGNCYDLKKNLCFK